MMVGAVVAVVGVFVLFNTDRTDRVRLIALSLLCGILWQPTLQIAQSFLVRTKEQAQDAIILTDVKTVASEIPSPTTTSSTHAAYEISGHLMMLNETGAKISEIHDPSIKAKATAEFLMATDRMRSTLAIAPAEISKRNADQLAKLRELPVTRADPERSSAIKKQIDEPN